MQDRPSRMMRSSLLWSSTSQPSCSFVRCAERGLLIVSHCVAGVGEIREPASGSNEALYTKTMLVSSMRFGLA